MSSEWIVILGALVTAVVSAVTVLYQTKKKQPQARASTTDSIADAARKVVEMQSKQIEKMAVQIADLDQEMNSLRNYVRLFRSGVKKLVTQLEDAGIEPAWTPDELPLIEDID